LVVVPLVVTALTQTYGHYVSSLWFWKDSGYYENHWMAPLSHITGIFWGARDWTLWGGFLDPVEGALVFLGLIHAGRTRSPLAKWLLAAFLFFISPGLLPNSFEPFRAILVAPILLCLMAIGSGWLLTELPARSRKTAIVLILALCAVLDLYHLWGPYHQTWGRQGPGCSRFKAIESWRAYDELRTMEEKEGPGLILDLSSRPDPLLRIAVHPFNVGEDPKFSLSRPRWFSLLADEGTGKRLRLSFDGGRWTWLSEHLKNPGSGLVLGLIPATPRNLAVLEKLRTDQKGRPHER
jgi:hypothetical protein